MYSIKSVHSRQIFDSRGNPTIECEVRTGFGRFVASVPSGASTGAKEAKELRDREKSLNGMGVTKAIQNVNEILSVAVKGVDCREQATIDDYLLREDGTPDKSKLGANALLSVSLACAKAGAVAKRMELYEYISEMAQTKSMLPVPALNVINGGKHAGNKLDFQEYQILPVRFNSFAEAFYAGTEVFQELKKILAKKYGKSAINVGDEGGFAPNISKVEEPLDEILSAIESAGYAGKVLLAMDVAASSFAETTDFGTTYSVEGKRISSTSLLKEYEALLDSYSIVSIEDPFSENDFASWEELYSRIGKRVQIVGDDLTVSQKAFVEDSIKAKRANALLLKVNQVGTLTEALASAKTATDANWAVQVSHRSGETNDYFIADLAVGLGCGQIKSGAPCRGERLAKYNRLLKIEEDSKIKFAGKSAFKQLK
ncbi:MAG: phosphopyruvate hydratase [archaeon]